ncbi:MAG: hypothetical protein AAF559_10115 [Pseudomonadota bacterium]
MELHVRQLVRQTQLFGEDLKLGVDGEYLGIAQSGERAMNGRRAPARSVAYAPF